MQQPSNTVALASLNDFLGQRYMCTFESCFVTLQDANQIDDDILVAQQRIQCRLIMYVDIDQIDCWQQNQFGFELFPLPRRDSDLHAKCRRSGCDVAANKAAAANNAEFLVCHGWGA